MDFPIMRCNGLKSQWMVVMDKFFCSEDFETWKMNKEKNGREKSFGFLDYDN